MFRAESVFLSVDEDLTPRLRTNPHIINAEAFEFEFLFVAPVMRVVVFYSGDAWRKRFMAVRALGAHRSSSSQLRHRGDSGVGGIGSICFMINSPQSIA